MRFWSILLTAFFVASPCLSADFKVATVNISSLLAVYPEAKAAHVSLQKDVEKKEQVLVQLSKEITVLSKELKNDDVLTGKQKKEKAMLLKKKTEEFQTLRQNATDELGKMETEAGLVVFNKLKALIATVAKEDGFDLVLDTDQTVYAKDAVDITEKVKKRFKGMKSN